MFPAQVIAVKLIYERQEGRHLIAHLTNSRGVGEKVDGVLLPYRSHSVVPPGLNVRDLLAVADGLDVVGSEGGGRAEQGGHTLAETVANCKQIL